MDRRERGLNEGITGKKSVICVIRKFWRLYQYKNESRQRGKEGPILSLHNIGGPESYLQGDI